MKVGRLRVLVPLAVIVLVAVGFVTHAGIGTLSAIGWQDISLLCPLGALTTMLASKLVIPRAVVSLVIAVVLMLLLGRAFCGWVCPVPVVARLRNAFKKKGGKEDARSSSAALAKGAGAGGPAAEAGPKGEVVPQQGCPTSAKGCAQGCSSCAERRSALDSRHFVLGGALVSAAVFGFPVFCLICPIGLTFATVLLVINLFANGDVTWAVVAVPVLLLVEVVFFRKWCHRFCPLGALMSLVGKASRVFKPKVDNATCLESTHDVHCGRCAQACPEGIDPRHPELGAAWSECTRCHRCVEACPAGALSMPLLPKKE